MVLRSPGDSFYFLLTLAALCVLMMSSAALAETNAKASPSQANSRIIQHIKGTAGIPLPNAQQIPDVLPSEIPKELLQQSLAETQAAVIESLRTAKALPRCQADRTTKTETGYALAELDGSRLEMDLLIIPAGSKLPLPAAQLFGTATTVIEYDSETVTALAVQSLPVECLPTRIRATRKFVHVQEGLDALRNYDKDQHGEGVLLPEAKQVLN